MIKRLLAACVVAAFLVTPSAAAAKKNPETDKFPPDEHAGYFLGYPAPTYSWHGCTKTATKASPATPQQPVPPKGTNQKAVRFSVQNSRPFVSWKAKDGWKICGVQIGALLANPTVSALLYAQAGYTSGGRKGSTVRSGSETIKVKIPKKGIGHPGFEQYEGKSFSIHTVQHVTVFVKKKS